jgi:hypothetical protein
MRYREVTERVIGAAFAVHNKLGWGFLEKVYENSLALELRKSGFEVKQQVPIPVFYDQAQVGEYFADWSFVDLRNQGYGVAGPGARATTCKLPQGNRNRDRIAH